MGKTVKKLWLHKAFSVLLVTAVLLISVPGNAWAATAKAPAKPVPPVATNNTNTLKVSPVRTDLTVESGNTGLVKTYITNITNSPTVVRPIENDFVAGDEQGTPSIVLDENSYSPTHSLKRFMVPLQNVIVSAGETKEIDLSIVVPKTAKPGGYFGAIRFAPANPDGSKDVNVNLSASVASLILLTVPGPIQEDMRLTNFDIQQNGSAGTNFRTPENMNVLVRFENKGSVQEAPFGQIYISQKNKILYKYDFNNQDPRDNVLPDSARRWNVALKKFGKFGKYTVGGTFSYGVSGKTIEIKKTVWIVPTTYIYAGIGAAVVLIVLVSIIVFGLRSYKRRILRSSSRYRRR
jgi:hypothetical protein